MSQRIEVYQVPEQVDPIDLRGSTAVVIDVLRATTTMIHALAAGAREIRVCGEVDEARALAVTMPVDERVLGGERGGLRIEGFDLGNSPGSYTPQTVGGKTVIFTTTNGTRALLHCREARRVLIAGFVNLSAIWAAVRHEPRVAIVCAGTRGEPTGEDTLLAGAIVARLRATGNDAELSASAAEVGEAWLRSGGAASADRRLELLRQSTGGQDLIALGLSADITTAAEIDRFNLAPSFATGTIR